MLEIKNIVTEMKNVFDRLTGRLDMSEKKISEIEAISTETPKLKIKERKNWKKPIECSRTVGKP